MNSNKLVLNTDKTHLLVMCSKSNHRKNGDFGITLNTGTEVIEPIPSEKLLGGYISSDFTWNNHIRDNQNSVFKTLVSRINALSKISNFCSFKTRKMIANGVVQSRLIYLIQLWGGCSNYLIRFLQILQKREARIVTKLNWFTPVRTLLLQCGWLSVHQLVHYHSLVLAYKIRLEKTPLYFDDKFNTQFCRVTRLATEGGIRKNVTNKLTLGRNSFIPRTVDAWNQLPSDQAG